VHKVSDGNLVAAQVVLSFQVLVQYVHDSFCFDGESIDGVFPSERG
jgi:hypothetical protein